jgi:hypothetical protein
MTFEQFLNTIKANQKGIENLMNRVLPINIGATAKAHFQDNFVKGVVICFQKIVSLT